MNGESPKPTFGGADPKWSTAPSSCKAGF